MSQSAFIYKVLLLGDPAVGKTCLWNSEHLSVPYVPGFGGVDFTSKDFTLASLGGKMVKLQIWDVGGSESFRAIQYSIFKDCKGCLVVFDVTRRETFDSVTRWITKISDYGNDSNPVIYLVGAKVDLEEEREISQERVQIVADGMGLRYFEVSSILNRSNIELVFQTLAEEMANIVN